MATIAEPSASAIEDAARRLAAGEVVGFPTETVYGLGADTFSEPALARVYELKGRPSANPLITHVLDAAGARALTTGWDERCERLAARFWPGPLTLVVPRSPRVPARAAAGLPTIGVRSPRHPVARELLAAFGGPISAPSANRSGHVSPTTARHVAEDFADVDALCILDGGRCEVGLESTVLDLTDAEPRVLRPGSVTPPELFDFVGEVETARIGSQDASPGTTPRHYAPETRTELVESAALAPRLRDLSTTAVVLCFDRTSVPAPHRAVEMPQAAGAYGRQLYETLRHADSIGADHIIVEAPPSTNEIWKVIHDRLRRATVSHPCR